MIDPGHARLSIVRQCELVSIGRSSFYREPTPESAENLVLMRLNRYRRAHPYRRQRSPRCESLSDRSRSESWCSDRQAA